MARHNSQPPRAGNPNSDRLVMGSQRLAGEERSDEPPVNDQRTSAFRRDLQPRAAIPPPGIEDIGVRIPEIDCPAGKVILRDA